MKIEIYKQLENYMIDCMSDSAHDREHIYRVLSYALQIAEAEEYVDYDVLIASCLLHDIGRAEQFTNPQLCHAVVGGERAYRFLVEENFDEPFADRVRCCIQQHRYRKNNPPDTLEARILFDADKLDATGAMGIARTLFYKGIVGEPLYIRKLDGSVSDGTQEGEISFLQEYKFKLEKIYGRFYTEKVARMARERQTAAASYYNSLLAEARTVQEEGQRLLKERGMI